MKTILIMRHSIAVSENSPCDDFDRPLTDAGRFLALSTAKILSTFRIDQIICSAAVRTAETADIIASHCQIGTPVHSRSLYLAAGESYKNAPADFGDSNASTVLVIGHNPGVSNLINLWSGDYLSIIPASVGVFQLDVELWEDLTAPTRVSATMSDFISGGRIQET